MQTFCPRHLTLDDVDCDDGVMPCPERVPVDPLRHVIVSCLACDKVRVAPVDKIMRGKLQGTGPCQLSECAATVVVPEGEPAEESPYATKREAFEDGFEEGKKAAKTEGMDDPDTGPPSGAEPPASDTSINQAAKPRTPKKAADKK